MKTCGWDDELPEDVRQQWQQVFQDLERLSGVHTTRYVKPTDAAGEPELHLFADARSQVYGACAYARWSTSDDSADVRLIASKSRVAPLKQSTIPRLELMAALLAPRLARTSYIEMKMKPQVFLWTDPQIVLHWLKTESSKRKAFVGVRVSEIQSEWNPNQWFYVPTRENPANDLSRGLKVQDVGKRWFQGPEFLAQPREQWPKQKVTETSEYTEEDKVSRPCFAFKRDYSMTLMNGERYSSWPRLARVTAYCLRFIQNLKRRFDDQDLLDGSLSPEEITSAEMYWIKQAQKDLGDWTETCADLSPFKKDNIVHVGGRLRKSALSYDEVHPILIPSGHVAMLILREAHEKVYHAGIEQTLSQSKLRFWIIRGRNATKKLVRNCVICMKLRQPAHATLMADLPPERVNVFSPPFTTTGIDLFGPFYLKYGHNKKRKV
ncbi:uncharacterized protein LOC124288973 [Haliotis rubra]|uniref:uncharacterized protein LOC124288973 n=1 Tax=Haliotis rubra TaxID=36100 RepID=UPI001EE59219|nr:uncharacterized protein LOC124288973 [Haliotis rubra]